jgi:hypothetical protein
MKDDDFNAVLTRAFFKDFSINKLRSNLEKENKLFWELKKNKDNVEKLEKMQKIIEIIKYRIKNMKKLELNNLEIEKLEKTCSEYKINIAGSTESIMRENSKAEFFLTWFKSFWCDKEDQILDCELLDYGLNIVKKYYGQKVTDENDAIIIFEEFEKSNELTDDKMIKTSILMQGIKDFNRGVNLTGIRTKNIIEKAIQKGILEYSGSYIRRKINISEKAEI